MRLAGTSDSGWVVVDLRDVADAIETLREAPVLHERAAQEADAQEERLAAR